MDTVLLYSGGMDSLVCAGLLQEQDPGGSLTSIFFNYGQHTAEAEEEAARECLLEAFGTRVPLLYRNLNEYGRLVADVPIVSGHGVPRDGEPATTFFVPGRNIIFLLYAAIITYGHGCRRLAYAPHRSDLHAGDCMPEFVEAFTDALRWGMGMDRVEEPYEILTPLRHLDKAGVVREGTRLGLPLHLSWSCYDSGGEQCGVCPNCKDRRDAYREARVPDPTVYAM